VLAFPLASMRRVNGDRKLVRGLILAILKIGPEEPVKVCYIRGCILTCGSEHMVIDQMLKSTIGVANTEDLIIEALRDLVKDEIKHYVRQKINENPEIKQELKEAVADFIDAKMRETYAIIKMGKCVAELGIQIVPAEMKEKLGKDVASLIEKEMSQVLQKM